MQIADTETKAVRVLGRDERSLLSSVLTFYEMRSNSKQNKLNESLNKVNSKEEDINSVKYYKFPV